MCFLSFPIVFRDSHRPFTDSKAPYSYIQRILNNPSATTNPSSSSPHPPPSCTPSNVSSKTLRTTPISFVSFFIQTPKIQLRTFTRSSHRRHRRRQPQTRQPHRRLPQPHHDRRQRQGNSHAAHLFRRGLCGGAAQVWHRHVGVCVMMTGLA